MLPYCLSYYRPLSKSTHDLEYVDSCDYRFPGAAPAPTTHSKRVAYRSRSIVLLNSSGLRLDQILSPSTVHFLAYSWGQRYSQAFSFAAPDLVRTAAQFERRLFLFRLCWSTFSLNSTAPDSAASTFLCRPPFHYCPADLRPYYTVGQEDQLAARIPQRSDRRSHSTPVGLPHDQ